MEPIISVKNLTKDYGKGRGIFDITFDIMPGQVFGYCGTNGSGKTTTIRNIMGFVKPDKGEVKVKGLDAWKDAEEIKKYIGYIPGEINFPDVPTGSEFLKIQSSMIGKEDLAETEEIIKKMQLDPTANLKRMSKGMKQKTAIANSFMSDPEILIFDEPTTGLDPLMRKAFIELCDKAKASGKTIFMSSHMFDELEDTCDYVGLIYNGHLLDVVDMKALHSRPILQYEIIFEDEKEAESFSKSEVIKLKNLSNATVFADINQKDTTKLFKELSNYKVKELFEIKYNLENYFNEVIRKAEQNGSSN